MKQFTKEQIEKRSRLVAVCHKIVNLFRQKKEDLAPDWQELFDKGAVEDVETLHDKTLDVVTRQTDAVGQLVRLFQEEQKELNVEVNKHLNYAELINAHFQFGPKPLVEKEETDTRQILANLKELSSILEAQKKALEETKGAGQQAYSEKKLRELLEIEFKLLQKVEPFWHDWELVVVRIEGLLENIDKITEEQWKDARAEIMVLLERYHNEYSNNQRASQLGTELAINLYLNQTEELQKTGAVPIAVVNIDMTACNNLDESHKLGDEMIEVGYEYLASKLHREFTKTDRSKISTRGVVTIWGRTRYKIVGVPKEDIVEALRELHESDFIIKELSRPDRQGKRYIGTDEEAAFRNLNTRMCVGYATVVPAVAKNFFLEVSKAAQVEAQLAEVKDLGEKTMLLAEKDKISKTLKELERAIAAEVDVTLKMAAARAEYLEKNVYPKLFEENLRAIQQKEEASNVPHELSIFYKNEARKIENEVLKQFPAILVHDGHFEKQYLGRNYIPEEEFEGVMIKRISHQIGLDTQLTRTFFEIFENARVGKDGKLMPEDAEKFRKMKEQFYTQVLQKRFLEKSYDLRMTQALREEDYDETVAKMSFIEGPQVMTFIEIDGFNAFNKIYKPDSNDTYYHLILKNIFNIFDDHFNKGKKEAEQLYLRMTKQGDEIWISYPLRSARGEVTEDDHRKFLQKVQTSLVSRGREALEVKNLGTAQWIPLLPLDREQMKQHIENCFRPEKQHDIFFVNNMRYEPGKRQGLPHIKITGENAFDLLSIDSSLKFKVKFIANNDEDDMSKWKIIDNARETTGSGMFGPDKFRYSEMLFNETAKFTVGRGSERAMTGRIIRLGTTMGYAGFTERIYATEKAKVAAVRKALNESVEEVRKNIARGELKNLQKLSYCKAIIDKALAG